MIWRDIILSKYTEKNELIEAFSHVFNIDRDKINIIKNVIDFRGDDLLTCIVTILAGDFCMNLDCYTNFNIHDEFKSISLLCLEIDCNVLITDDAEENRENPYSFVLFAPHANPRKVEVSPRLLDEEYEIKIIDKA